MSRLARKPIIIPQKVSVVFKDKFLEVSGPLGTLKQPLPPFVKLTVADGQILVGREDDSRRSKAMQGLCAAFVKNALKGVTVGFTKELEIHGIGFKAALEGNKLSLSVGFTHPVKLDIPQGIKVSVDPKQTLLTISGVDKYAVGQFAADIRKVKPPEPYKGTGIRYKDEKIIKKAGKTAAGAAGGTAGTK